MVSFGNLDRREFLALSALDNGSNPAAEYVARHSNI
jgi:hypothetical protein